jgi:predicted amidohydrolase YtcJ
VTRRRGTEPVASAVAEVAPDLILHSGRIATLDPRMPEAEAVAALGGRIVAVGRNGDVRRLAGARTRVIDARGRRVIPGLMDNHTHYVLAGLDSPEVGVKVNIAWARSIAEIVEAIGRQVAVTPPGEWIATSPMFRGALAEGRFPNRHDLDAVSPGHPVYVFQSGKNIIVNSYALRLAGITRETPDPRVEPEGHIVRGGDGEPTGHLIAGAADMARLRWWERLGRPPKMWDFLYFPQEKLIQGLESHGRTYLACGVVAVRDMGVSVDEVDAYVSARRQGRLPVRTDLILGLPARYLPTEEIERRLRDYFGPRSGFGDDWLRVGGLKLVVQNDGWWAYSPGKLRRTVLEANRQGWTLAIHVSSGTSRKATGLVLDVLEEASREAPIGYRRFSYEHGFGLTDESDISRVKALGMIVASSPLLAYYGAARSFQMHDALNELRITKEPIDDPWKHATTDWALPFRDWLESGLTVTAGTDNPAVPYDSDHPLLGMHHVVTGETLAGVLLPGQGLSRHEALRMWTINNAYAMFQEDRLGSIELGKLADLVMLSDDLLTCPDKCIKDITVLMTVIGGHVAYER